MRICTCLGLLGPLKKLLRRSSRGRSKTSRPSVVSRYVLLEVKHTKQVSQFIETTRACDMANTLQPVQNRNAHMLKTTIIVQTSGDVDPSLVLSPLRRSFVFVMPRRRIFWPRNRPSRYTWSNNDRCACTRLVTKQEIKNHEMQRQ